MTYQTLWDEDIIRYWYSGELFKPVEYLSKGSGHIDSVRYWWVDETNAVPVHINVVVDYRTYEVYMGGAPLQQLLDSNPLAVYVTCKDLFIMFEVREEHA